MEIISIFYLKSYILKQKATFPKSKRHHVRLDRAACTQYRQCRHSSETRKTDNRYDELDTHNHPLISAARGVCVTVRQRWGTMFRQPKPRRQHFIAPATGWKDRTHDRLVCAQEQAKNIDRDGGVRWLCNNQHLGHVLDNDKKGISTTSKHTHARTFLSIGERYDGGDGIVKEKKLQTIQTA